MVMVPSLPPTAIALALGRCLQLHTQSSRSAIVVSRTPSLVHRLAFLSEPDTAMYSPLAKWETQHGSQPSWRSRPCWVPLAS